MNSNNVLDKIHSEMQKGISLDKCQKCGCMQDALEQFKSSPDFKQHQPFVDDISNWLEKMVPIEYSCLSCKHCYPAVATNLFYDEFSNAESFSSTSEKIEKTQEIWPPILGEYFALCESKTCNVAVSTLGSIELAQKIRDVNSDALCIVGKTETENIGLEKLIKNTISNPTISALILTGIETQGHYPGKTLLALIKNGVDERNKVIGSPGKRPILNNIDLADIDTFRKRIKVIDMIGCEDVKEIIAKVNETSKTLQNSCGCTSCDDKVPNTKFSILPSIQASPFAPDPKKIKLDKAGYFVIVPREEKKNILVEHYSYKNELLRTIEGSNAREIYFCIIENNWVTLLSHASYIGKELAKAELSMEIGFKYVQDAA